MSANVHANGVDPSGPIYADIMKSTTPVTGDNNKAASSNNYNNNDTVIYSDLQNPDSPDVYENVARSR